MGTIFLARHGETSYNRQGLIQGPRIDPELDDRGRMQAHALGNALADSGIEVILSSPLRRAWQTALTVVQAIEEKGTSRETLAVQKVPEMYEVDFGDLAGRPLSEVRGDVEQIFDAWQMGFVDQAFPGGESALLAQTRVRPFAERLRRRAVDQVVMVVGHGRINRILLSMLLGTGLQSLEGYPQGNAAITELSVADKVAVVRLNDRGHLDLGDAEDAFS